MDAREQLLDLIYDTALEPGLWVSVMERFADLLGGSGGCLTAISTANGRGSVVLARVDPSCLQVYDEHYARLNVFTVRANPQEYMSTFVPRVTTERDFISPEDLHRTEYYNGFMRPTDTGGMIMIDLAAMGLDITTLNIHRGVNSEPWQRKDVEFAQWIQPHLTRAFRLGEAFSQARDASNGVAAALDVLGQGVVIVDVKGRILHANAKAEQLFAAWRGIAVHQGRLVARDNRHTSRLEALIGTAGASHLRCGGSMRLPLSGHGALAISVTPLRDGAFSSIFGRGPAVVVTISDESLDESKLARQLKEEFGLTAAEIRVAMALFHGKTPRATAGEFDVSVNTVRSQMASIFGKTQTSGQVALSRLMMKLSSKH